MTYHFNEIEIIKQLSATAKDLCIGIVGRAGAGKTFFAKRLGDALDFTVVHTDDTPFVPLKSYINDGFGCLDAGCINLCDVIIYLDTPLNVAMNVYKNKRKDKKAEHTIRQWEVAEAELQNYKGDILYYKSSWWEGTKYAEKVVDMEKECREFRARASQLSELLTDPNSTKKKEAGELSDTAKTMLRNYYISTRCGIFKSTESKYTEKGNKKEDEAIEFTGERFGISISKNTEWRADSHFSGTCDVFYQKGENKIIIDTKCSFSPHSFFDAQHKYKKEYATQMQAYMHLWGAKTAYVCYCLLPTPTEIIGKEIADMEWRAKRDNKNSEWVQAQKFNIIRTGSPDQYMSARERFYAVKVDFDENIIQTAKVRIEKAREYLLWFHNETERGNEETIL